MGGETGPVGGEVGRGSRDRDVPALISESWVAAAAAGSRWGSSPSGLFHGLTEEGGDLEDRWAKLEEIVRRVVREEIAALKLGKQKLGFVNGKWLGVTEEQMTVWADAYPSCDLVVELKKAAAWIVSNPHLAPKSQLGRFLNTWFARQQNQLSIRSIPTRSEPPPKKECAYCEAKSTGSVGGRECCDVHFRDAMDQKPVKAA